MDNPLEQDAPANPIEKVHTLARDLAYGVSIGKWGTRFHIMLSGGGSSWRADTEHVGGQKDPFIEYVQNKWDKNPPSHHLMDTFGYFTMIDSGKGSYKYLLTEKCFELLEKPPTSPNTFISYRRGHSTALALYLESRLRHAGNNAVFVDRVLEPGSKWRDELETKIRESKYLIALCTHGTFDSDWVRRELDIAKGSECRIIPVLHPAGRKPFTNNDMPADLGDYQTIKVQDATAAEYETAANKLLSYMGYATY